MNLTLASLNTLTSIVSVSDSHSPGFLFYCPHSLSPYICNSVYHTSASWPISSSDSPDSAATCYWGPFVPSSSTKMNYNGLPAFSDRGCWSCCFWKAPSSLEPFPESGDQQRPLSHFWSSCFEIHSQSHRIYSWTVGLSGIADSSLLFYHKWYSLQVQKVQTIFVFKAFLHSDILPTLLHRLLGVLT